MVPGCRSSPKIIDSSLRNHCQDGQCARSASAAVHERDGSHTGHAGFESTRAQEAKFDIAVLYVGRIEEGHLVSTTKEE